MHRDSGVGFLLTGFIRDWVFGYLGIWVIVLGVWVFGYLGVSNVAAATFDEQRAAMAGTVQTQPESAIMSLLKAGLEEGKAVPAIAEAQQWLRQNRPQEAALFYHAGRAAELSGDWKGAVALYQQYLAAADLKSETADDAVYAVYTLLIDRLNDTAGAYAFGRNEGGRLMVCPRARQFDKWFLDEAVRRQDAVAVAGRLTACIESGLPVDLLVARYDNYFRWLLGGLDTYLEHGFPVTQDLYDSIKDLSAAMTFDDEMKLRLDWAVSVKAYNLEKIGADGSKKIVSSGRGGKNKRPAGKKQPGGKTADKKAAVEQAAEQKELELGDNVVPPIAEAAALLEKYPRYVLWVLTGWAGGGNGPYYRGDFKKYWPHEAEAKMAPIMAALSKLTPAEVVEFLNAAAYGNYVSNPGVLEIRAIRDYLRATPDLWKFRNGVVILPREWNQMSQEEAKNLAPRLEPIAHPRVSLVRAIAAGGKDYDKVMEALLGAEVWRLGPGELGGQYADSLWHYCGRPGGNQKRDDSIAKSKAMIAKINTADVKPESQADKRIAAFKALLADYRSASPKQVGVYGLLSRVLQFTPEVISELLKDPSPEAQILVRDAIESGMTGADPIWKEIGNWTKISTRNYDPFIFRMAQHHRGMDQMKQQYPQKCKPHPLEDVFRKHIAEGLKQNRLEPWLTMAWINMQFPEDNAEQIKLMQAMFKSPVWQTMPFEVQFAARAWFGKDAMTPGQAVWIDAGNAGLICKELLALTKEADAAAAAAVLGKLIEDVIKSPVKIDIQGMDSLAGLSDEVFSDQKVMDRILEIIDSLRHTPTVENERAPFAHRLCDYVTKHRDPVLIHRVSACLWGYAVRNPRGGIYSSKLKPLAESLLDEAPAAASALARAGVDALSQGRALYGFNPAEHVASMKALTGRAAMKMGLMVIPVPNTDPSYPVYKSQADWLGGNEDSAWNLCSENWEQLISVHRQLSVEYVMWVLQRAIYSRDEVRQEELVKALMAWANEANTPLNAGQRVKLDIAYGDIAVQRGMLKEAREIFKRISGNKAFDGILDQHEATLRQVRVERMAKDYDEALNTISELEMKRVPEMWAPARFARAEIYFDMEEYGNAADDVNSILARESTHSEAKIMQGKLQIKRQRLMEATEVELGTVSSQQALVPGEKLKVTLIDPTLAVSGAGTEVEVVVWAESGDRETFFLRQFGDEKTKFRGEVATALGAPNPNDRVLQVIGDDNIYYAYSENFRKKMNNMEEKRGGPITVASDALLMASARKLLSEAEQRVADAEKMMASIKEGNVALSAREKAVVAARNATAAGDREALENEAEKALITELLRDRIKPGNPIYVRVIDPDSSRTAEIDEVVVSVSTSSGDSIGRVVLKETGTHTGWFEGIIPTAGAQAMAFAANSEPGRNPNMVISSRADYPAWRPVSVKGNFPEFKIDLNDNVSIGELILTAGEKGSKLKKFVLQTGMNDLDMTTVAVYPENLVALEKPWDPGVTIMNDTDHHHVRDERSVYDIRQMEQQLDRGWMMQQFPQGVSANVAGPSAAMTNSIPNKVRWRRNGQHETSHVIYRFRGYFYEPAEVTRRFRLDLGKYQIPQNTHPSVNQPAQFLLAVNGQPITDKQKMDLLEGEIRLKPGVHRFEIWATGWNTSIGFGRSVKVLANLDEREILALASKATGDGLVPCPDSFFDPSTFPGGVLPQRNSKAEVTSSSEGVEFKIKFAPGSRTRMLNLIMIDQEGPVPAINKIALTDAGGGRILPVKDDYAELNKNETLEILTGDKVAVRYVDDRFVSSSLQNHERILNVAFTTATMQFEFSEVRKDRGGDEFDYYERILRYELGKPLILTIKDADMDISAGRDKVEVTLQSKSGGKRQLTAMEDVKEPGTFRLRITPVSGTPADDSQFKVAEGEEITAIYRDEENTEPGVPADRFVSIKHALFSQPQMILSHSAVAPHNPAALPPAIALYEGFARIDEEYLNKPAGMNARGRASGGTVQPRWVVSNTMMYAVSPPAVGFEAVHGQMMYFDIIAPYLALRVGSVVDVYVQTDAGRKRAAELNGSPVDGVQQPVFDIAVPGTIRLMADLQSLNREMAVAKNWRMTPRIPIYLSGFVRDVEVKTERFSCSVPLIAGMLPDYGVLDDEEIERRRKARIPYDMHGLIVQPGERVHIGFSYTDPAGAGHWLTASAKVITHPVLDIMESDYRTPMTNAFVGEELFIRVVDLGADVSDRSDSVKVFLQAQSGAKHFVELNEVDTHSGVFKGVFPLSYAKSGSGSSTNIIEYDVKSEGFPVVYGDVMGARYQDAKGVKTDTAIVRIRKGADGLIEPFSKKYEDQETAMRTQFALAESYLELAKHHRALGQEDAALLEYDRAKQMLANAIDQFRDPETRAHAEYLLGNLTQEEADATEDVDLKESRYRAALSRFMNVTGTYPDTIPASKAQFKIATVYEKLNEPDIAAQEYVKLAYKYPDSEFLATAMARLGTHFQRKAAEYEKQAKPLLAKVEDKDAQFEGAAMEKMAVLEYLKAANIFVRLQETFPDHELAGRGGLRAGQSFMRAGDNRKALKAFLKVADHESYDGPDIRAQAMYWAGMCYENLQEAMAAYSIYKRLTYDFPESKWASYARAQLSQERLLNLETDLEVKRVEEGR